MNTLVIDIPPYASAPQSILDKECHYTRLGKTGGLEQQGKATLEGLRATIRSARKVVLLLAAVDVTLLRRDVPPLGAGKLRAALPNLVEEQLLEDAQACVFSCTAMPGTLQTIAVAKRSWIETLLKTFNGLGAQRIVILPSQISLPLLQGQVSGTLQDDGAALCLRLSEHEGLGLIPDAHAGLLHSLRALVPMAPITLFLDNEMQVKYAKELAADAGITIKALNATHSNIPDLTLDLAAGLSSGRQSDWDWRPWRWPLVLAAALLLTQTLALNLDWWHMSRESRDLRSSMRQIYLAAYPKESVILDPLLQMQQKIAASRHAAGLSAADDFDTLVAGLGAAWSSSPPPSRITALSYQDHRLQVTLQDKVGTEPILSSLAQRGLTLEVAADDARNWTIRSLK